MNWITNYVRPRINSIFSRRETPENLWSKCDGCGTMLFHRELKENLNVCTSCGHHMAISPRDRFTALFDGGIFTDSGQVLGDVSSLSDDVALGDVLEIQPAALPHLTPAAIVSLIEIGGGIDFGTRWLRHFLGFIGLHDVTVVAGERIDGLDFGNYQSGSLLGRKWHDINGDGVRDADEPYLN